MPDAPDASECYVGGEEERSGHEIALWQRAHDDTDQPYFVSQWRNDGHTYKVLHHKGERKRCNDKDQDGKQHSLKFCRKRYAHEAAPRML